MNMKKSLDRDYLFVKNILLDVRNLNIDEIMITEERFNILENLVNNFIKKYRNRSHFLTMRYFDYSIELLTILRDVYLPLIKYSFN